MQIRTYQPGDEQAQARIYNAVAGALLSYGPNYVDLYRRAAAQVNMILNGTEAGSIPVEQPMTFDFVVNATTAQALGITLPGATMLAATEVVP